MSRALGSAKQRRAGVSFQETNPLSQQSQVPSNTMMPNATTPQQGLTLPQVISLVDTRLVKLEKFMNEGGGGVSDSNLAIELDDRFNLLASEVNDLKEVVYKLQTYTMEVNKSLLEHITKSKDGINTLTPNDNRRENIKIEKPNK